MQLNQARYLATQFVEGKIQSHFIVMAMSLQEFIHRSGPDLEAIEASIVTFGKKRISEVFGEQIAKEIIDDLRMAEQSLYHYNITFSTFNNRLGLVTSNFGLQEFLKEHAVALNQTGSIATKGSLQAEIEAHWLKSYGPLFDFFVLIHEHLAQLQQTLSAEVRLLQLLSKSMYASKSANGFDISKELRSLFQQERQQFWAIDKLVKNNKKLMKQANDVYEAEKSRARIELVVYLDLLKKAAKGKTTQLQAQLELAKSRSEKAVTLLLFTAGAVVAASAVTKIFIEKATGVTLEKILQVVLRRKDIGEVLKSSVGFLSSGSADLADPLGGLIKQLG